MKTLYTLTTRLMNGTVTMHTSIDNFATRELAEKALEAVKKANGNVSPFTVIYDIQTSELFETEDEVPILKKEQ